MSDPVTEELLNLNQRLLDSITTGDWATYEHLCAPSLTAFEPEGQGHLVEGLGFHQFFFNLGGVKGQHHTTMSRPHVRIMGDVAVVAYVRLNQRLDGQGQPTITGSEETRIWQRHATGWKHVHFHRSPLPVP
jgi:calcium/calmodulin-dependent protein kinase (CaM kinase) II